jgi:acetoin:2,6-dichlorophenolindophenol oxidoreductase subunit beta
LSREISFAKAINEALFIAMELDPKVLCYGLGVDDPMHIFDTTIGLQEEFGKERVFDMPTSENAMTGVAIGASLVGYRPIMVHQRLDFFLLAMDQLVNAAAKWHYMFGGHSSVPIVIRLIIGRGWGQGPTHSQSLQSWFAHIPGLKVVMPSSPREAKGLLLSSIFDENPVLFLEHRWLHNQEEDVPEENFRIPLGTANLIRKGTDITIVGMSYMNTEALRCLEFLKLQGISCELIDLRSINPIDWSTIIKSVKKTKRLLVLDTGSETGSLAAEIIAKVSIDLFADMVVPPARICLPDSPVPASYALTEDFYPTSYDIAKKICFMLDVIFNENDFKHSSFPHDIPGDWFKGPF